MPAPSCRGARGRAADAGSAPRPNRRRSALRSVARDAAIVVPIAQRRAQQATSRSVMSRSPARSCAGLSGNRQPKTETAVRMTSMGWVVAGSNSSTAQSAGGARATHAIFSCRRPAPPWSATCRGSADRQSPRTRRPPQFPKCRSRGNADRCPYAPRCTARWCRQRRRRARGCGFHLGHLILPTRPRALRGIFRVAVPVEDFRARHARTDSTAKAQFRVSAGAQRRQPLDGREKTAPLGWATTPSPSIRNFRTSSGA